MAKTWVSMPGADGWSREGLGERWPWAGPHSGVGCRMPWWGHMQKLMVGWGAGAQVGWEVKPREGWDAGSCGGLGYRIPLWVGMWEPMMG